MNSDTSSGTHFLLDASCFYAVGGRKDKQEALRRVSNGITTSILAALEISNVKPKAGDFERRKAAMGALTSLCPNLIAESPDDVVALAFGMERPSTEAFDALAITRTFTLASSGDEALAGVFDPEYGVRRKLVPTAVDDWKKHLYEAYRNAIALGNRDAQEFLPDDLTMRGFLEMDIIPADKETRLDLLFKMPAARFLNLLGIAVRAGLLRECEERYGDESVAANVAFIQLVARRYSGKLEPYVSMSLAYRKWLAPGREPERNAVFDLEYFLHLDAHGIKYTFVTCERKWQNLAREALPGRVMSLDDVLAASGWRSQDGANAQTSP